MYLKKLNKLGLRTVLYVMCILGVLGTIAYLLKESYIEGMVSKETITTYIGPSGGALSVKRSTTPIHTEDISGNDNKNKNTEIYTLTITSPTGSNTVYISSTFKEMTVNNLGGGRVLSPLSQIHNCGESSLQHSDLDKVGYTVNLVGGTMIDCKPRDGMVRMVNNQGKIVCTFQVPSVSAYTTPLQVDLTYNYIQSTRRPLKIIQTPR